MFVETHGVVPLPLTTARAALDRALADGGLVEESRRAYAEGVAFLMRVGPRGAHGPAKQVLVQVLPSREVGSTVVVPLRWQATGSTGRLFPALDANLGLTEAGETATLLSIVGRYAPPLGRLGPVLDRAVMARAANGTAEALVREVVAKLRRLGGPGDPLPDRDRR